MDLSKNRIKLSESCYNCGTRYHSRNLLYEPKFLDPYCISCIKGDFESYLSLFDVMEYMSDDLKKLANKSVNVRMPLNTLLKMHTLIYNKTYASITDLVRHSIDELIMKMPKEMFESPTSLMNAYKEIDMEKKVLGEVVRIGETEVIKGNKDDYVDDKTISISKDDEDDGGIIIL